MFKQLLVLLLLLCGAATQAQNGVIAGTVYDEDGFPMLGANVAIQGTSQGAQTDFIEGKYQFSASPGTYVLSVTYVGYGEQLISDVIVQANETTIVDVTFEEDSGVQLDLDVTVTAQALERGEVAVLKLRQNSNKVEDIISSQEIQRLGANNAGDALKKVTGTTIVDGKYVYVRGLGDRYSATTVNGLRLPSIDPYRNSAQLDLIPTNLLDNITASKTFTPDLPGDFTGGSVNVKLKALPERFTWGLGVGTTYNSQNNFRDDFISFDAGERAWLGASDETLELGEFFDQTERFDEVGAFDVSDGRQARRDDELAALQEEATDILGRGFTTQELTSTPLDYSVNGNIGNQFQVGTVPVGVFGSASYARSFEQYRGGIAGNYENGGPGFNSLVRLFSLEDNRSVENVNIGGMLGFNIRPTSASSISLYSIYSHQGILEGRNLQGAHDRYGAAGTDDSFFRSENTTFQSRDLKDFVLEGQHTIKGLNNTKIEWAGNYVLTEQIEPGLTQLGYIAEMRNGELFEQVNESNFALPTRFDRALNDVTYQGKVDFTVPILQEKNRANAIKFGGQYLQTDRDFNETIFIFDNRNGMSIGDVDADPSLYFADSNMGVIGGEAGRNDIGVFVRDNTELSNNYVGNTDVTSAYGMVTFQITDKLKAIAGLRFEQTGFNVTSARVPQELEQAELAGRPVNQNILDRNQTTIDTTSFLPALNLVFAASEKSNIRASFTQTIARPNMREVAPFRSVSFGGSVPVFGNPDLMLTSVDNYDLRYEIFPGGGEVLAFSAFYKKFRNPIVTTFRLAGNQQYTWSNSDNASLYGLEVEARKDLAFISQSLSNFTLSGNMAFIQSEQDIDPDELENALTVDPDAQATRPFSGQSPFVANLNLSYETVETGWDAVVAYNYFGDRLSAIGAIGAPDVFEQGRSQLDLSVGKRFNNLKLTIRARNLINPEYRFFSEFKDTEEVFGLFKRGRDFSLGVSYSI